MNSLNVFLGLLARTDGRDIFLRLIQYATLFSVDQKVKGSTYKVYRQMRMTRKLLRFLRTLQYSSKIKEQLPKLKNSLSFLPGFFKLLASILQNLFRVLFYLSDHRVCLGQLGVIDKNHATLNFPRSMCFYFFENLCGFSHNLISIALEIMKGKNGEDSQKVVEKIKRLSFDMIRCLMDCLVALYYWKNNLPANKIGILGVITSLMAIIQMLGLL